MVIQLTTFFRRLSSHLYSLLVSRTFRSVGRKVCFRTPFTVSGASFIEIGSISYLGPNSSLEAFPSNPKTNEPVIRIGSRFSATSNLHITAMRSVVIEDDVLVARFVHISDHSHNYNDPDLPIWKQGTTPPRPVRIGQGSWLAQGVVVCPGVTIGKHCVIGANSVVTKDIPDYSVAAGTPARVLKSIKRA